MVWKYHRFCPIVILSKIVLKRKLYFYAAALSLACYNDVTLQRSVSVGHVLFQDRVRGRSWEPGWGIGLGPRALGEGVDVLRTSAARSRRVQAEKQSGKKKKQWSFFAVTVTVWVKELDCCAGLHNVWPLFSVQTQCLTCDSHVVWLILVHVLFYFFTSTFSLRLF